MFYGFHAGDLEIRRAGGKTRLRGKFPYGKTAVLSDGGRKGGSPKKERIRSRAFRYRIENPDEDIHLLSGHRYDRPLASRSSGTLNIKDTNDAVVFEAEISPDIENISWVRDALAGLQAGLIAGISPGFRLPPPRTEKEKGFKAETIEQEKDEGPGSNNRGAIIRTINDALLFEMSLVTLPAYPDTQIEMRNWDCGAFAESNDAGLHRYLQRWRP